MKEVYNVYLITGSNDSVINNKIEDNSIIFSSAKNLLKLKKELIVDNLDNKIEVVLNPGKGW